jgi:hypothetical protein
VKLSTLSHLVKLRWLATIFAFFVVAPFAFAGRATTSANSGGNGRANGKVSPEPKEFAGGGAGTFAAPDFAQSSGTGTPGSPVPPGGSLTISGAGEIRVGKVKHGQLRIGTGATKPEFDWKASPSRENPPKKKAAKPTSWSCGGAAEFEKGYAYSVSDQFFGNVAPDGTFTGVNRPSAISGPYFVWINQEQTSGTLYVPKIKTQTELTAKLNPNGWRKTVGVGEKIRCDLVGAPTGGAVEWSVSGAGGCEIDDNGYMATIFIGDEQGIAVVRAVWTAEVAGTTLSGTEEVSEVR